jgi:fumarate reductase flavoprotein subunit
MRLEADVVVVGGGGAGLAAALEAAGAGRRVVLMEKNPYLGGTTRLAVGSVTACCTPHQLRKGIQDSAQAFYEDIGLFNQERGLEARDNLELRRLVVETSSQTLAWLADLGVEFFGPMPEPPNRHPRMHNAMPNASAYIYVLARRARKCGIDIQLGVRAQRLLTEAERVCGVEATARSGQTLHFNATHGVVLASGDYSSSRDMKQACLPPELVDVEGINPASTGDGHRMAMEVGAQIVNGDLCLGPEIRFVAPSRRPLLSLLPPLPPLARVMNMVATCLPAWLLRPVILASITTYLAPSPKLFAEGAILVNKDGQRFVDELGQPALAIPRQPDRVAYIVFDNRIAQQFSQWPYFISTAPGIAYAFLADYRRNRRDIYAQSPTLEGLARALKVPAASLTATVADYNRSVEQGHDAAFGRASLGQGLRVPPYYALGPAKSWIVFTDGGLAVTTRMEVLNRNGQVIPGLYAAGATGQGGVLLEAHGLHLLWAFTSGRIAGRYAAAN